MTEGLLLDPPSEAILQNRFNLFALDVWQGSLEPGTPVVVWGMHHGANQRWRFESLGEGVFRLRAVHSGLYLEVFGANPNPGAIVGQWGWNGGNHQRWTIHDIGNDEYMLRAVHSGLYLQSPQVHPQTSLGATGDNPCTQEDWSGNTVVRWYLAVP
jgi:hypothetical protein